MKGLFTLLALNQTQMPTTSLANPLPRPSRRCHMLPSPLSPLPPSLFPEGESPLRSPAELGHEVMIRLDMARLARKGSWSALAQELRAASRKACTLHG